MRQAIVALGLASVILLSMGFLALAIVINRRWTKEATPRHPDDE